MVTGRQYPTVSTFRLSKQSPLEREFYLRLVSMGVAEVFTPEYRFHPTRQWRIDFADIGAKVAVEIEGGAYSRGGHTRGAYYRDNCEKYNELACLGWSLLRYSDKRDFHRFEEDYRRLLDLRGRTVKS